MVKRIIIRLLFEHGPKLFRSVINAYKDITKSAPNASQGEQKQEGSKFGLNNLISTPMTKEEAMKILSLKEDQLKEPAQIMEQFEKYMMANDPEKGGSFYIQNKIYYSKELLMKNYPEQNISKYNPDYVEPEGTKEDEAKSTEETKKDDLEGDKKI
jgi:import inner membrane translocase subunit TIM16